MRKAFNGGIFTGNAACLTIPGCVSVLDLRLVILTATRSGQLGTSMTSDAAIAQIRLVHERANETKTRTSTTLLPRTRAFAQDPKKEICDEAEPRSRLLFASCTAETMTSVTPYHGQCNSVTLVAALQPIICPVPQSQSSFSYSLVAGSLQWSGSGPPDGSPASP